MTTTQAAAEAAKALGTSPTSTIATTPVNTATPPSALNDELYWYKDAIIYELHIKAFCDGNGDGIGDFEGLMQKLDYLQDLGITAIWLLPFYPSPLKDDGYDIADYYTVNGSYGSIAQFRQFMKEAHKRNLKVITELVINHTSNQHPWFQRAITAPKGSPERNFYVWTDDPTQYKDVRIIFQDFETSNWTLDPVAGQYFWHRFFHHQPDLNYDNPQVREEVFKIIDFWCRMGVDGFRLDAVPYLFEREGTNGENLPETHAFLKTLRRHVDENFPGTVLLAEANMWPEDSASYFGQGDECHMNYHFPLMPRMFMALQMEDRYPITDIFDQTPGIPDTCQWAIFLRNHDELTLEMVTDEERDYMYQAYARDPKSRINLGIRHRLAPLLDNSRRKIELMNSLLFALPGTPVIYYGDEIGMGDNFYLGDRDGVRTPMQWSPDRNAGFSQANPQKLYLPLILDPEYHYESVNVETQRGNTSSLFWYMKRLVGVRRQHKAFGRGNLKFLSVANPKVLSFTRIFGEETLLIVTNLSKFSQAAEIDLSSYKGYVPVDVFSGNRFPVVKEDGLYFFTMGPYSFQWFVLEKAHPEMDENAPLPLLILRRPEDLMDQAPRRQLENNILSRYLKGAKWFAGTERTIYSLSILDHAAIPEGELLVFWLLVQVGYQSGQPEIYQLPVAIIGQAAGEKLLRGCPEAVIAKVSSTAGDGMLCDAFFMTGWQQALIAKMAGHKRLHLTGSHIDFYGNPALKEHFQEQADIRPRVHSSDQYNISINYDSSFFLKMYRKVEYGLNPDMEIMRFLTGEAGFRYIPAFIGAIEWKYPKGTLVLGAMQEMVENHGTGSSYFQERYNNYTERIAAADRKALRPEDFLGSLTDPVALEELPEDLQALLGAQAGEQARLLGVRTAEMHLALASRPGSKDFSPEPFSLNYQRSLFSALQTLVRETYQGLITPGPFRGQQVPVTGTPTPESHRQAQEEMTTSRGAILSAFRRIYTGKLDACKIRVHGNFHLEQILLTGKDLAIRDFDGNGALPYSERRLKRSSLVDIASMVGSFYQLAFDSVGRASPTETDTRPLLPFAGLWAHYLSGFFIKAYKETVADKGLIPADQAECSGMLRIYLLQQALHDLNEQWNVSLVRTAASLAIIRRLIGQPISPPDHPDQILLPL